MSSKLFTISTAIFLAVAFSMFLMIDSFGGKITEATGLVVSSESFPTYLQTHPVASSLPKSALIGLSIGDKFYEINGDDVYLSESKSKKDLVVYLPEGFESVIGELGLCEAVKKAHSENKLKIEIFSSKSKLLLKYRKLLKYSDCLN